MRGSILQQESKATTYRAATEKQREAQRAAASLKKGWLKRAANSDDDKESLNRAIPADSS